MWRGESQWLVVYQKREEGIRIAQPSGEKNPEEGLREQSWSIYLFHDQRSGVRMRSALSPGKIQFVIAKRCSFPVKGREEELERVKRSYQGLNQEGVV